MIFLRIGEQSTTCQEARYRPIEGSGVQELVLLLPHDTWDWVKRLPIAHKMSVVGIRFRYNLEADQVALCSILSATHEDWGVELGIVYAPSLGNYLRATAY